MGTLSSYVARIELLPLNPTILPSSLVCFFPEMAWVDPTFRACNLVAFLYVHLDSQNGALAFLLRPWREHRPYSCDMIDPACALRERKSERAPFRPIPSHPI